MTTTVYAGRFDFEDGGTYCGGWEDGKAHGQGVCTGPKSMGEFSGVWQFGYEVSGIYIWPSGNCYQGQWMSGKRHGLGVEKKQRWVYKGEWSQGFKGRYGSRISEISGAKYEGTWANGLQDGYGSETYADGGTYFGQMAQGMRNGYGVRKSVAYGSASRYRSKDIKDSLTSLRSEDEDERVQRERDRRFDENRGGFVLRAKSDPTEEIALGLSSNNTNHGGIVSNAIHGLLRKRRNSSGQSQERKVSLRKTIMSKLSKQKSVNDIDEVNPGMRGGANARGNKKSSFRSTSSNNSVDSRTSNRTAPPYVGAGMGGLNSPLANNHLDDGEHSFISQDEITDINCIEIYMGEWKQDKRTGFGIAERSDGLKYEGEWFNNKKNGYGVTTFKDGTKEEGKYKNNVLINEKKKGKLMILRPSKQRERVDTAVNAALRGAQISQQRADIALSRAVNARAKSQAAEIAAKQARNDSETARIRAHEVAPDFIQPGELKKMPEIFLDLDKNLDSTMNESLNTMSPKTNRGQLSNYQQKQESLINLINRAGNASDININGWQQFTPTLQNRALNISPTRFPSNFKPTYHNEINQMHDSSFQNHIDLQNSSAVLGNNNMDFQKELNHLNQLKNNPNFYQPSNFHNNDSINNTQSNLNRSYRPQQMLNQKYMFEDSMEQNHSINETLNNMLDMDVYNNELKYNENINEYSNSNFQRNNPKRTTLKRSQRVMENSVEDMASSNNNSNLVAKGENNNLLGVDMQNNNIHGEMLSHHRHHTINNKKPQEYNNSNPPDDSEFLKPPNLIRRKSLPSIVKNQIFKEDVIAHSSSELNDKNQETFIIENGIRKRITEKSNSSINDMINQTNFNKTVDNSNNNIKKLFDSLNEDQSPKLPRKIIIESITSLNTPEYKSSSKRESMPSIPAHLKTKYASKVMSREEANRLSSQRREQIRKYGENIAKSNLMKLKAMFPDYLNRHKLFLAMLLFNLSLAIWFFQLLK